MKSVVTGLLLRNKTFEQIQCIRKLGTFCQIQTKVFTITNVLTRTAMFTSTFFVQPQLVVQNFLSAVVTDRKPSVSVSHYSSEKSVLEGFTI